MACGEAMGGKLEFVAITANFFFLIPRKFYKKIDFYRIP
jgi:hypothetical protein